jgi:hypothetical protein
LKAVFFLVVFTLITFNLFSFGRRERVSEPQYPQIYNPEIVEPAEQPDNDQEDTMKIRGQVRIYGSEPHTVRSIPAITGIRTKEAARPFNRIYCCFAGRITRLWQPVFKGRNGNAS